MQKTFDKITWIFWLGLVAVLPITSMPLVAKLLHSSSVAPASIIFLLLLCLTWLPVYLYRKGTFPFQVKIVLAFAAAGILSTAGSFFLDLPVYKNQSIYSSVISGLAVLVLGLLFYLLTTVLPHDENKIKGTLKVLCWGGGIMLLWDISVWFISWITPGDTPNFLRVIQHVFSTTTFFGIRSVGFASEPSWEAHLLNMAFLPYWLSATLMNFSVFKKRFGKISVENILLVVGVMILFKTLSRAGLAAFLLVLGFFFIRFNIWIVKKLSQKWASGKKRTFLSFTLVVGFLFVYIGGALGIVYVLSKVDPRMQKVFSIQELSQGGLTGYANLLQFGERVTYWQTGWRIFNAHPIIGVGLGNAGYYFPQLLPDDAWQLSEVRNLIYHSTALMNIKSLWSRTLAETGIVGFSLFLLFLVVTGFTSRELTHSNKLIKRVIGWMGISMLIAFLIEGFSVDNYALPYLWFTTGMVAAAWRWVKEDPSGA